MTSSILQLCLPDDMYKPTRWDAVATLAQALRGTAGERQGDDDVVLLRSVRLSIKLCLLSFLFIHQAGPCALRDNSLTLSQTVIKSGMPQFEEANMQWWWWWPSVNCNHSQVHRKHVWRKDPIFSITFSNTITLPLMDLKCIDTWFWLEQSIIVLGNMVDKLVFFQNMSCIIVLKNVMECILNPWVGLWGQILFLLLIFPHV